MANFFAKKFKCRQMIAYGLIICFLIVESINTNKEEVLANENLNMYSGAYALTDGKSGRVLQGKKEDIPMANASTTKILTCIIALENCELNEMVTVSLKAASQPRVKWGIQEGKQYLLKDLLYGLMLESYNDCAVAIAEHISGSAETFAKKMNEKTREIGCTDTYFITPNGLDAEDGTSFHHTTAQDLCKIMKYCTWESPKNKDFLKITQTRNYGEFVNHNSFLNSMDGVLTGKTGFTNKAGYCYVAAMEKNGERYCIALLACGWPNNKNYKWKDARTLFEYGLENYEIKQITANQIVEQITVKGFVSKSEFNNINSSQKLNICASKYCGEVLMSKDEKIRGEVKIYSNKKLPITKGDKMGICNIYIGDVHIDSYPLYASENVYIWGWKEILYTIFYQFLTFSL